MFCTQRIADLLTSVTRKCFEPESLATAGKESQLIAAKECIEFHYREPLRVENLARHAGMSAGHFQRQFLKAFNTSPIEHQQRLRISAACNLLRSTALLCSEIAEQLGFSDVFYFSKTFKRRVGVSPLGYRKK